MRRNLCAFRWPRAAASLLSITAALALHGCSKPGALSRLPGMSGKAAADADDRDETRKREDALAGTKSGPKVGSSGKASINTEPKEASRSAGPVTVDRSGLAAAPPKSSATSLESAARNAHASRGRTALEAPDLPTSTAASRPTTVDDVAQRTGERDGVSRPSQVAGASWDGGGTRQRVSPVSRERSVSNVATDGPANRKKLDAGEGVSRRESIGSASLDSDDDSEQKSPANDWTTRVARSSEDAPSGRSPERRKEDHPSSPEGLARLQVERLMGTARTHLTRGELFSAQRTALLAERLAAREKISFGGGEEHPTDLVRLIDRELDLSERGAIASRGSAAGSNRDASLTFDEATNQFAAWRPADESARPQRHVQTVAGSRDLDPVAGMERKPFASNGREIVSARGESVTESRTQTPTAWSHLDRAGSGAAEPAWNTDRSPVALSSSISGVDEFVPGVGGGRGGIVPAVSEEGSANFASPKSLMVPSGTAPGDTPLFMPSINLPEQQVTSPTADGGGDSLAVASGPLLPATSATQTLDNVWEEELSPAADEASEGFGRGFWALTSGILAAGAVLFGVARRVRRAERGV